MVRGRLRLRRAGRRSATASSTVGAFAHSRANSAQNTRAHVSASGSARWLTSTSIPSDAASDASPRRRASGAKRRASAMVQSTGGSGHVESRALERLAQDAPVEGGGVRDEHASFEQRREVRAARSARLGRLVDHRLRDAGEALNPARQRAPHPHERRAAVVQLAAPDEHRADLGELAASPAEPVRLDVDGEELGGP